MLDTFASVGFVGSVGNEWFMGMNFFRVVEKGYNLQFL